MTVESADAEAVKPRKSKGSKAETSFAKRQRWKNLLHRPFLTAMSVRSISSQPARTQPTSNFNFLLIDLSNLDTRQPEADGKKLGDFKRRKKSQIIHRSRTLGGQIQVKPSEHVA